MKGTSRVLPILLVIALVVSACGTGGGGSVTPEESNAKPPAFTPPVNTSAAGASQTQQARVTAVAAGSDGSLAVMSDGTVWVWGMNVVGVSGNNAPNLLKPQRVEGIKGVVAAATSGSHSLALTGDGTVWAWGTNDYGELGVGGQSKSSVPQKLDLPKAVAVDAAESEAPDSAMAVNSMALAEGGTVWVWGGNDFGQLGLGRDGTSVSAPKRVAGLTDVTSIACGKLYYGLAVQRDGTVRAWGRNNSWLRLGIGRTERVVSVPTTVQGLNDVAAVAGSAEAGILALRHDGTVWVWGWANPPKQVPGLSDVIAIAAGTWHFLALRKDGTVWAWGRDAEVGTLGTGQGDRAASGVPHQVIGLTDVVAIATGADHSLALAKDGTVWAWGCNNRGQLGDGTMETRAAPVRVKFPVDK